MALPLPSEIQAVIFDLLLASDHKPTLAAIARASHHHLALARPRLYEHIELDAENTKLLLGDTGDYDRLTRDMASALDETRRKQCLLALVHKVTFLDLAALDICLAAQPTYDMARMVSVTRCRPRPGEGPLSAHLFPNITLDTPGSSLTFSQPFLSALQLNPGPYLVRGTNTHALFHILPSSYASSSSGSGRPHLIFHLPAQPKPILNAFICDMLCAYTSRVTTIVGVERGMSWDLGHTEVEVFEMGMKERDGKSGEEMEGDIVHSICEHIYLHPRLQGVLLLPPSSSSDPSTNSIQISTEQEKCARIEMAVKAQSMVGKGFFVRPSGEGDVSGRYSPMLMSTPSSTKDSDMEDIY
ncbi:hypothetical protein IAR50_000893 [Cryptococcus sp. DSM 104548]